MKTVKDVLDDAVREYNRTLFGKNSEFHSRTSYLERRGIFYNCLRRQFQYSMSNFNFTDRVGIHNLSLDLRVDGSIESFRIDRPYHHINGKDSEILEELRSYSNIEYLDTEVRINFDSIKDFTFKF